MIFFKKKKPAVLITTETDINGDKKAVANSKPGCKYCRAVITAGRSGEKEIEFANGDTAKVEIINESKVPGRMCYTLNILNDPEVGWNDIPIRNCPFCGRSLRRRQCR